MQKNSAHGRVMQRIKKITRSFVGKNSMLKKYVSRAAKHFL
jgi:hypothetical protein